MRLPAALFPSAGGSRRARQGRVVALGRAMLAAALGLTCGPSKEPPVDSGQPVIVLPQAEGGRGLCSEERPLLEFKPRLADVLILFDRSGSMNAAFGSGTRYSVETALLRGLLPHYEDKIRFGFAQFPSKAACGGGYVQSCCADRPSVSVGPYRAEAIASGMEAASPVDGNTPTAEALRLARDFYADLEDGVEDRYVLLSTDGRPNCTARGRLSDEIGPNGRTQACEDALAEVDALGQDGVKVIVVGVGPAADAEPGGRPSCLQEIARRGGVKRPDGSPGYFGGEEPAQLETALQQIFGGVIRPQCMIELKTAPPDPSQVRVYLDGKQVPRNRRSGWDYETPSEVRQIRFHGQPCSELERFKYAKLEVQYGCGPPCVEEGRCE